jgi:N-carbamoyl-L-amino-acid hydrolase
MTTGTIATRPGIDRTRFERMLRQLARIGADPRGGVSRLGLSDSENQARAYLSGQARQAGLVPEVDPAGNLLVRRGAGTRGTPVLLLGSHTDSVLQGGWLDGAYGVVAALEVLTVLAENDTGCELEPVVACFANEEGALIQYPFWGSRALAGSLVAGGEARDRDGGSVASYLRAAGGDPDRLDDAAWPPRSVAAFLELHIEQGPVLERRGVPVGVVDAIVGRTVFDVDILGESGHPGTVPMSQRKDALAAAAALVLRIEDIAGGLAACSTATVGFLEATPNTTNTIPGSVRLTAEIRDTSPDRLAAAEVILTEAAAGISRSRNVDVIVRRVHASAPVATDARLCDAISRAARELGLRSQDISSGAGHDAQIVAGIAPVGMIFVPSKGGISHTPAEDTGIDDLVAGAEVLLHTVLGLTASRPVTTSRPLPGSDGEAPA